MHDYNILCVVCNFAGKADVWAIGALIYAMAVGDPAPTELTTEPRERLVAVIGQRTGSEGLSLAAHRALDPDPSRRPSVHQVCMSMRRWMGWGRMWRLDWRGRLAGCLVFRLLVMPGC